MERAVNIFFPFDVPTLEKGRELGSEVGAYVDVGKVGLELMHHVGTPAAVALPKEFGLKVMADAKLIDIPPTVEGGIAGVISHGVDYVNLMACGGRKMIAAGVEKVHQCSQSMGVPRPKVIAVTVLTSLGFADLIDLKICPTFSWCIDNLDRPRFGYKSYAKLERLKFSTLSDEEKQNFVTFVVMNWAEIAIDSGVDVVLTSPKEARAIHKRWPEIELICPGIRPPWSPPDHQTRKLSPYEAVKAGVYNQVIGSPIRKPPPDMTREMAVKRIRHDIDRAIREIRLIKAW